MHITIKLVTETNHHLWTDALHARELARSTTDKWCEGTYVRWTILSAWIVLEQCCEDALNDKRIGSKFRKNLDRAIKNKGITPIKWGKSPWKEVIELKKLRNYYTHENASQKDLWPGLISADEAIETTQKAIRDIYSRVGQPYPTWIDSDDEVGFS